MNEQMAAADWAATRGEKWRAQLTGLEAMLKPVEEPLIQALQLGEPWRIADIACGGGGTTREILRRAPAGSVIHGFDISPTLIEAARGRVGPDERGIQFEVANVATASAPGELYQRLVSRFGIMFFDDPPAAFANLSGWLAPRGRFAFAVWGPPSENPWRSNVRKVVAEIIDLPPTVPDAPEPFRYAEPETLLTLLARVGLGEFAVGQWRGFLSIGGDLSAPAAADFALASISSFGELLAAAGGDALQRARRTLTEHFCKFERDGKVQMEACVHIVSGVRLRRRGSARVGWYIPIKEDTEGFPMQNLFEDSKVTEIKARISQLTPESQRLWGKMSAAHAMAHGAGGLELALGEKTRPRMLIGRIIGPLVKRKALEDGVPFRKNSPTVKGLVVMDERNLAAEQQRLSATIDRFVSRVPRGARIILTAFLEGFRRRGEFLMFKHLDHHLRQFGV